MTNPQLEIDKDAGTLAVSGEWDMATTFAVEPALERAVDDPRLNHLTLDLTDTTSIGVEGALSLPVSAPVPKEYAAKYDKKTPSEYDQYVVLGNSANLIYLYIKGTRLTRQELQTIASTIDRQGGEYRRRD